MKKQLKRGGLSFVLGAAALACSAGDVTWEGEGAYSLEADGVITLTEDTTITTNSTFTGTGTIRQTGGTLTLSYQPTVTENPFLTFAGTLAIEDATLDLSLNIHAEDKYPAYYGIGESTTLKLSNATISNFSATSNGTNNDHLPAIVVADGTENVLTNVRARQGNGINLTFGKSISGSGNLSLTQNNRVINLRGDNSAFSGVLTVSGESGSNGNGLWFYGTASAPTSGALVHTREERIYLDHQNGDLKTFTFGALMANGSTESIDIVKAGTVLSVGATGDSAIAVPFITNQVALEKVGAETTLTLGDKVTFEDGSSVALSAGTLAVDGTDLSGVTFTAAEGTTVSVGESGATFAPGVAFATIALDDGAALTIPASDTWTTDAPVTLFTYVTKAEGVTFSSDIVTVKGLASNYEPTIADTGSAVTLTLAYAPPTWNASGSDWTDANAWTDPKSGTAGTYADDDSVRLLAEATETGPVTNTIYISTAIKPGTVRVVTDDACAIRLVGTTPEASFAPASLVNNGTLILAGTLACAPTSASGSGELVIEGSDIVYSETLANPLTILEDAQLTLTKSQAIANTIGGPGTLVLSNMTLSENNSDYYTEFSGLIDVVNSTFHIPGTSRVWLVTPGTGRFRLRNGNINWEKTTSISSIELRAPVEVVSGTTNQISSRANYNFTLRTTLTGGGYLRFRTGEGRGPILCGDATAFTGSIELTAGNDYAPPTGVYGNAASSENAVWIFPDNWTYVRDGDMTYTLFDMNVNGDPVRFGALRQTGPLASIRVGSTRQVRNGLPIEIGGRADTDSVIEGKFTISSVRLTKIGAENCLTLGTNFAFVANSTFNVTEGRLGFNLPQDEALPSLENSEVTIDESVAIRVNMTSEQYATLRQKRAYTLARLATNPGNKPEMEIYVDGEKATGPFAKTWCVRYVDVAANEESGEGAYVAVTLQRNAPLLISVR